MQERRLSETLATLEAERDAALDAAAAARRRVAELERELKRTRAVDMSLRAAVVELQIALRDLSDRVGSVDVPLPAVAPRSAAGLGRSALRRVRRSLWG